MRRLRVVNSTSLHGLCGVIVINGHRSRPSATPEGGFHARRFGLATPYYPVDVSVEPALTDRNRLTVAFRIFLALPHLILVGGPMVFAMSFRSGDDGRSFDWSGGGGVLGAVAVVCAMIGWFAIVFGFEFPRGLRNLVELYLRWHVRAVAFRLILAVPHLVVLWLLGIAWALTSIAAWFSILFTGNYPPSLYRFGCGMLRWNTRVEAYVLLLRDEYPPFSLD